MTLDDAEEAMLKLYCERSNLKDGHTVLDLGCGWGSLVLYIAKKYTNCRVTGISYSTTQKAYWGKVPVSCLISHCLFKALCMSYG